MESVGFIWVSFKGGYSLKTRWCYEEEEEEEEESEWKRSEEEERERKSQCGGEGEGDKSNKSEHVTAAVFNTQLMEKPRRERERERRWTCGQVGTRAHGD